MKVAERNGWTVYNTPFTAKKRQLQFFHESTDDAYALWIAARRRFPEENNEEAKLEYFEEPVWLKAGDELWCSEEPTFLRVAFHEEISAFLVQQRLVGAWTYGKVNLDSD